VGRRAVAALDIGNGGGTMKRRFSPRRQTNTTAKRLAVYDGLLCIGEIEDRGRGRVVAYAVGKRGRIKIGNFANRLEAMRAVSPGRT
jgi:hypothetical protein